MHIVNVKKLSDIIVSEETLYEIITKVEQKRIYIHIFCNGLQMGEFTEVAMYCYWILKLMPFKHKTISNSLINAKIAFAFFINMIFYLADKINKKLKIKENTLHDLLYSFQYRNLSEEAILALAESLLNDDFSYEKMTDNNLS